MKQIQIYPLLKITKKKIEEMKIFLKNKNKILILDLPCEGKFVSEQRLNTLPQPIKSICPKG